MSILDQREITMDKPLSAAPPAPAFIERCIYCDDSGDVHDQAGVWRGRCTCPIGVQKTRDYIGYPASPAPVAMPLLLSVDCVVVNWRGEKEFVSPMADYFTAAQIRERDTQWQAQVDALREDAAHAWAREQMWAGVAVEQKAELDALRAMKSPSAPTGAQPLTDEQIADAIRPLYKDEVAWRMAVPGEIESARLIERAHGITGTPAPDGEASK